MIRLTWLNPSVRTRHKDIHVHRPAGDRAHGRSFGCHSVPDAIPFLLHHILSPAGVVGNEGSKGVEPVHNGRDAARGALEENFDLVILARVARDCRR